jgi:hypothetical protein
MSIYYFVDSCGHCGHLSRHNDSEFTHETEDIANNSQIIKTSKRRKSQFQRDSNSIHYVTLSISPGSKIDCTSPKRASRTSAPVC